MSVKAAIVNFLGQRMEHCTKEQVWMLTILTSLNTLLITSRQSIVAALPNWIPILFLTAATIFGEFFIIRRHISYYFYRSQLAKCLGDEGDVPCFLKDIPDKWKNWSLERVGGYSLWIISLYIMNLFIYVVTRNDP